MLDPRLRQPLRTFLGDEPDGVQSMYFYKGSEQRRHQDAFFLPGCMSAWVALQPVSARNGSIHIQVGSHKGDLIESAISATMKTASQAPGMAGTRTTL